MKPKAALKIAAILLVVAGIVLALSATLPAQSAVSVPNPTVIGPIPATVPPGDPSHGYPFFSTNLDLASHGYVEEEFFLEGMANTYNVNPMVSKLDTAIVTGGGYPFKTRMIVRRPLAAEDFNGTVLMEWQNVTSGFEPDALWIGSHDHIIQRGYAWIGVSAQRAGITFLKASWNPSRYGTLKIPNTGPIMGDTEGLSWDIFSQAAQAVRHPQGVDPLGGLPVERLFAVGWSQSANRLSSYHNSIHPLANAFDAFALIGVHNQWLPLRTDLDVKVFKVLSEADVAGTGGNRISQALLRPLEPNTDHFRRWEVAGAAHLGNHEFQESRPLLARDVSPAAAEPETCALPPLSRIPSHFVMNAAYDHMVDWVKHNVAPPIGPDIEVAALGTQNPVTPSVLARDEYGNARGGIRLSQHAVPTATNTGLNTPSTIFCLSAGSHVPFDQTILDALYPDHQAYLDLVIAATHETQKAGFIVGADAAATIREAARSDVGRH